MKTILLPILLLFLASCAPSSWEDLRAEGESETRRLTTLLRPIDTKDDLIKQLPKIKKSYLRIADLVLEIRVLKEVGALPESPAPSEASDALFAELARLYEMPGCRDLLEEAQKEAFQKLK